jgi:hypothetical protein
MSSYEEIHDILKQKYKTFLASDAELSVLNAMDKLEYHKKFGKFPSPIEDAEIKSIRELAKAEGLDEEFISKVYMACAIEVIPLVKRDIDSKIDFVLSAVAEYLNESQS